eukprot:4634432-Prorocentrum_lima.AAC.1
MSLEMRPSSRSGGPQLGQFYFQEHLLDRKGDASCQPGGIESALELAQYYYRHSMPPPHGCVSMGGCQEELS